MRLNTLSPAAGSRKTEKRLGRGIGSGLGKTSGRGHKGQDARSGGGTRPGFEGGQMPLQRRLPKIGFNSMASLQYQDLPLDILSKLSETTVTLAALRAAKMVKKSAKTVKLYLKGEVTRAYQISGVKLTKGARAAVEAKGGTVEMVEA